MFKFSGNVKYINKLEGNFKLQKKRVFLNTYPLHSRR